MSVCLYIFLCVRVCIYTHKHIVYFHHKTGDFLFHSSIGPIYTWWYDLYPISWPIQFDDCGLNTKNLIWIQIRYETHLEVPCMGFHQYWIWMRLLLLATFHKQISSHNKHAMLARDHLLELVVRLDSRLSAKREMRFKFIQHIINVCKQIPTQITYVNLICLLYQIQFETMPQNNCNNSHNLINIPLSAGTPQSRARCPLSASDLFLRQL